MKTLIFATGNPNKLAEVRSQLSGTYEIKSLEDIGCLEEIPEPYETLEENAKAKVDYVFKHYGLECFAEDTGLEVEALNGEPGVYSARYAGESKSADLNMEKVLSKLEGETNRKAKFRTVVALILNGQHYSFEGMVEGEILKVRTGEKGFGYDPIFRPIGHDLSFAQMATKEEKAKFSHRGRAIAKFIHFLGLQAL